MTYALDTNVIIDFLRKNKSVENNMRLAFSKGYTVAIPSIVYFEIVRGFKDKAEKRLREFHKLNEILKPLYLDRYDMTVFNTAVEIYVNLRQTGNLVEDNDIYVAATAIANNAVLVTDNIKHFSRVEGLKLVNWKE